MLSQRTRDVLPKMAVEPRTIPPSSQNIYVSWCYTCRAQSRSDTFDKPLSALPAARLGPPAVAPASFYTFVGVLGGKRSVLERSRHRKQVFFLSFRDLKKVQQQ